MSSLQVKSAVRALAMLELFQRERRPLSALRVAENFGWPAPSTHVLLKTLVGCGYLIFDPQRRVYFSSPRLCGVTGAVPLDFFEESNAPQIMHRISDATGLSVTLAIQSDLHVQLLYDLPGLDPVPLPRPEQGPERVVDCSAGLVLLAGLRDRVVDRICRRTNISCREIRRIDPDAVLARVRQIRCDDYCLVEHHTDPAIGEISVCLPATQSGKVFAITVSGKLSDFRGRAGELHDIMKRLIAEAKTQHMHSAVAA